MLFRRRRRSRPIGERTCDYAVFLYIFHQGRNIGIDAKQRTARVARIYMDVFKATFLNQWSQDKYIAFCGAPEHLMGIAGCLNTARA